MNKRDFVAGSVGAILGAPALASQAPALAADGAHRPLAGLRGRTQRLPDLVEQPGLATFEAYVGERFTIVAGDDSGSTITQQYVKNALHRIGIGRGAQTEQFTVGFATSTGAALKCDGMRVLEHGTGQRIALHLENAADGVVAHFNLLV